jgi:hypothetical protein
VGSHKVIKRTHINVVPDAEIARHLQITLGALDVLHPTISAHMIEMLMAVKKLIQLNAIS